MSPNVTPPDATPPTFPDVAYLDWIVDRPERAEYDLGSSDLHREAANSGDLAPPPIADVPTPETTVVEQLAAAYGVAPENVVLTAGATHANFLAAAAALREAGGRSDRILVEKPGYEPLVATPRGLGATVDRFGRPESDGYPLDPGRIEDPLTDDAAMVTVTNRHNPSGRRVGRAELADVATAVGDADARLLVDEVYAPFGGGDDANADGEAGSGSDATGPFGGPTATGLPNAVVTNSLTKFPGFPGVRLGWLVADEEFAAQARAVKRHVPAVAEPSRLLARRALDRAPELAAESRARIRTNRDALAEFVAARGDLSGRVEPGCTYAFLEHESADGNEVARAAWERDVLVVPGRFFEDPDGFRIAAGRDPEAVRAGLDRFGDALDSLDEA